MPSGIFKEPQILIAKKIKNCLFGHNNKFIDIVTKQVLQYMKSRKSKLWHTTAYILVIYHF